MPQQFQVQKRDGSLEVYDRAKIRRCVERASHGLEDVSISEITNEAAAQLYDGITTNDIDRATILAARARIVREPNYSLVAARLLLNSLYKEVFHEHVDGRTLDRQYREAFVRNIGVLVDCGRLDASIVSNYDLERLAAALRPERDLDFKYLGLQTLYDRYLLHKQKRRLETPQALWMRVAMGLCFQEQDPTDRAIAAYEAFSQFLYCPGTPTLFNSGTTHSQLSSCYLSTMDDSIDGIFGAMHNQARLSKYAGGLGVDFTPLRGMNSHIQGTNGESQGVVPWLKIFNDTLVAVNQCFAGETLVHTNHGPRPISEIIEGDLVLTSVGEYRTVNAAMAYEQSEKPMVRIKVKHASESVCVAEDHPVLAIRVNRHEEGNKRVLSKLSTGRYKMDWVEVGDLRRGDYVAQAIPTEIVSVVGISEDDAFLYGLMLGNGHFHKNEAGVTLNLDKHQKEIAFVKSYLDKRKMHWWEIDAGACVQIRWTRPSSFFISYADLYNENHEKTLSSRLSHLPLNQSRKIIQGLVVTDGNVSRGKEITFCNTSRTLIENIRYQLLRNRIPTAANKRVRAHDHVGVRQNGAQMEMDCISTSWDVRIPAVDWLAAAIGAKPVTKFNWLEINGLLFTRVKSVVVESAIDVVYDLKVDGPEDYMTTSFLAHNGGKRKGAGCAYLEPWHSDIQDFLELRKNTGDDRRRCHDMNTAVWIPDLFLERVQHDGDWCLFSPSDCPELHETYGKHFQKVYEELEAKAECGQLQNFQKLKAKDLWKKLLTSIYETGHPWITFKDPSNLRYPNQHVGVVHSSNLCCVSGDGRAATSHGLVRVDELAGFGCENEVAGRDGIRLASRMEKTIVESPIVLVKTREGYEHKVTPDHPLWVVNRGWVEAQDLVPGDRVELQQTFGLHGYFDSPALGLIAGIVAGDGTYGEQVCIDIWNPKTFEMEGELTAAVLKVLGGHREQCIVRTNAVETPRFNGDEHKKRLSSSLLSQVLSLYGFTKDSKLTIPEFVWRGNRDTVAAYLRGIYAADGTIQAEDGLMTTVSLTSVNRDFLRQIQILLINCGVKSRIRVLFEAGSKMMPDGNGGHKSYECQKSYRLLVTSTKSSRILNELTGLGELRKHDAFLNNIKRPGYKEKWWAVVESVAELPPEDVYCLMVNAEDRAWTCDGLLTKNTEILLHTHPTYYDKDGAISKLGETAVCNLGSLNLAAHLTQEGIDWDKLEETIHLAVRLLDNVIDINFYPTPEARNANTKHRPVGLGTMGWHDVLHQLGIPFDSVEHAQLSSRVQEFISYQAIIASASLAGERSPYSTYDGSTWSRGQLPLDTYRELMAIRPHAPLPVESWPKLAERARDCVADLGMRNSNVMAIAPTATISFIVGCSQSIEPDYSVLYTYSTLSGEFTMVNEHFVRRMKSLGKWTPEFVNRVIAADGDVAQLDLDEATTAEFKTCFDVDYRRLIDAAAARQIWIDQGQSLNLYCQGRSLKQLNDMYLHAWESGLKTTYYLRTKAVSKIEKSYAQEHETPVAQCRIDNPNCESCQ